MITQFDDLLRSRGLFAIGRARVPWIRLAAIIAIGGLVYGAVMGSYGLRTLQALYSAIKVPMLLLVSMLICLPSFAVINTALGLRDDLSRAVRGILSAQATLAIALGALAPVTVVGYLSLDEYLHTQLFNGAVFLAATIGAQVTVGRHYAPLIEKNPRHRIGKAAWLTLYIFVAIQMAWVLRPFIGAPTAKTQFFREDAWSNAYVHVFGLIRQTLFVLD